MNTQQENMSEEHINHAKACIAAYAALYGTSAAPPTPAEYAPDKHKYDCLREEYERASKAHKELSAITVREIDLKRTVQRNLAKLIEAAKEAHRVFTAAGWYENSEVKALGLLLKDLAEKTPVDTSDTKSALEPKLPVQLATFTVPKENVLEWHVCDSNHTRWWAKTEAQARTILQERMADAEPGRKFAVEVTLVIHRETKKGTPT